MTDDLKIRHIDFDFEDAEWNWNPGNPRWGNCLFFGCFMAPGFERYFIRAIREVIPRINDPEVAKEADLFCKQEAIHSKHHHNQIKALDKKYPGLQKVKTDIIASYDELFERETTEFHLAYACVLEAIFPATSNFVLENRDVLFQDADPKTASFILWHLMEEYEHRNAALNVYKDIVGGSFYKFINTPKVIKHLVEVLMMAMEGFDACVPPTPCGVKPSASVGFSKQAPWGRKIKAVAQVAETFSPFHNPDSIKQPEWVDQWFKDETAGVDMREYFPAISP